MVKTRKIIKEEPSIEGGLPNGKCYCRKCQKIKNDKYFYKATDLELDKNGFMSVCKDCINSLYVEILEKENGIISKAFLRMCRMLNIRYDERALSSSVEQIKKTEKNEDKIFGLYRLHVLTHNRSHLSGDNTDLTYMDNPTVNIYKTDEVEYEVEKDVEDFWGSGYSEEEYAWLERTMDDWKKTHKCDTKAEETLLKEIVFKQFQIEEERKGKRPTSSLVKELQELMKTASVDPAKSNIAGAGKSQDTFSAFIKMIEEGEPAEVFGDEREAFKDFQGIGEYFNKYVVRSIKNFITGSRDFNLDVEEDEEEIPFEQEEYDPLNYSPEEDEKPVDDGDE